jgi:hypothetical protein
MLLSTRQASLALPFLVEECLLLGAEVRGDLGFDHDRPFLPGEGRKGTDYMSKNIKEIARI